MKKISALTFLLLPLVVLAQGDDIERMKANAQFLADHPVVAKIAHRSSFSSVPLRNISADRAPQWQSPQRGPEHAALPEIWGNVVGSDSWTGRYSAYGAYEFNPCEGFALSLLHSGTSETMHGNGGAVKIGNKYHLTYWYMGLGEIISEYYVWNTDTWTLEKTVNTNDGGLCATDLAYDRLNNVCYGSFFTDNQDGWELGSIDFSGSRPVKTSIGRIPIMVAALGVNKAGEIYGICEDGVLYKFDKTDASYTRIGDTGVKVSGYSGVLQQTGEFDQHSDIFYWASSDLYGNCVLYTVDVSNAKVTKLADIPDRAQILNMQIMAPKADDKAPGFIKNLKAEFADGSLAGKVSFTVPSYSYDGSDLSSVSYTIAANGAELASDRAAAGTAVNENVAVQSGDCHLEVWVENAVGRSPIADTTFWAGPDVPVMKQVTYAKEGNKSTINWSANDKGTHGGWVGDLSFKVVRMPDEHVVAENVKGFTATDIIPDNVPLDLYTYVVTPFNSGLVGEPMASNGNVVGNAVVPPYFNDFNDKETSMNLMEVLNNNKDKYTWTWATQTYDNPNGVAKINTGDDYADTDYDDWILTPEISLEAGKTYELSFRARCTEYYYDMNLRVMYGPGTDVTKYEEIMPKTNMAYKSSFKEYSYTITPAKSQNVRIGFHCEATYASGTIMIDDLRLSQGTLPSAPACVTDIEIIPDAAGRLETVVKFAAPAVDHSGAVLSALSRIDIYCDNVLAKSIDKPAPGATVSETVPVESDGTHTFRIETFNESGAGDVASASAFVGVDVPASFPVWIEEDGTNVIIKWQAPTKGENGHYINPDELTYNIYSTDGYMLGELLISGVSGTTYSFIPSIGVDEGEQGMILFGMRAVNRAGQSRGVTSSSLIVGKPYDLPIVEHFDGSGSYYYEGDTNVDFNTAEGDSSDGDKACFVWYYAGNTHDAYKELRTLKLGTKDANKLRMTFDYKITGGGRYEIYVIKADGTRALAGTFNSQSADGSWSKANLDLSAFASERFIRVAMRFVAGSDIYGVMYIDNICIQNAVDKDLLLDLSVPSTAVRYGQFAKITATVTNKGLQSASDFTVTVFADDVKVGEEKGSALEFMDSRQYAFQYEVRPGSPEKISVKVVISYDGDENPDDNIRISNINVGMPKVSAPENLILEPGEDNALSWSAPSEFYTEDIAEDFEAYSPWTIYNMGDWTLYDGDGAAVIGLGDADYPNEGQPQAFTIFNPSSIGVPSGNTEATPHSGSQYAACFAAKVSPTMERNDDWLISTLLPGTEQDISFYAKQMIPDYGAEKVEILYSTTGRELADFVKVEEFEVNNYRSWKKFTVRLPEGTLYFAFHVVTRDGHIFMLDDVEFTAGSCRDIVAWNVYRDGEFLAEVPAGQLTFTDGDGGLHRYNVTAVYATGEESAFSNDAKTSGITDTLIDGGAPYNVFSIDGRVILLNGESIEDLAPGIYIINGEKVLIRK